MHELDETILSYRPNYFHYNDALVVKGVTSVENMIQTNVITKTIIIFKFIYTYNGRHGNSIFSYLITI